MICERNRPQLLSSALINEMVGPLVSLSINVRDRCRIFSYWSIAFPIRVAGAVYLKVTFPPARVAHYFLRVPARIQRVVLILVACARLVTPKLWYSHARVDLMGLTPCRKFVL